MKLFHRTGSESAYGDWWRARQQSRVQRNVQIDDLNLRVSQGVFNPDPAETNSVSMFLRHFPVTQGKRVLEIGTGCGVLAIKAAQNGSTHVVATDIDDVALADAQENADLILGDTATISWRKSHDFIGFGTFDIVLMNIIFAISPDSDQSWQTGARKSLALHARLFDNFEQIVSPKGAVYLGFASFGDIESLDGLLCRPDFSVDVQTEYAFDVNWYLIKVKRSH